jgi:hypothetical protein
MRRIILAVALMVKATVAAAEWPAIQTVDLTPEKLNERLLLADEIMVLSLDGTHLFKIEQAGTTGVHYGGSSRYVAKSGERKVYIYSNPFHDKEKGYGVNVSFYKKPGPLESGKGIGLIDRKTHLFKDFSPLVVEVARTSSRKTVIRYTLFLDTSEEAPRSMDDFTLNLKEAMLIKNKKEVVAWATGFSGKVIVYSNPATGVFELSLAPFKGAILAGTVEDNRLSFKVNGDRYVWLSRESVVPGGPWELWVRHARTPLHGDATVVKSGPLDGD